MKKKGVEKINKPNKQSKCLLRGAERLKLEYKIRTIGTLSLCVFIFSLCPLTDEKQTPIYFYGQADDHLLTSTFVKIRETEKKESRV